MDERHWASFSELSHYKEWIENNGQGTFTFKVGVFDNNRFLFDQSGHFFHQFVPGPPPTKLESPATSVLGVHSFRSMLLSSESLYAAPEEFLRQGDILDHDAAGKTQFPETQHLGFSPSHWIILTQTCSLAREMFAVICPVFTEDMLTDDFLINNLGIKPPNPRVGIRHNKKARLLAFPPHEMLGAGDQCLVVDLGLTFSMRRAALSTATQRVSLTFPANAYFCNRAAMFMFRDVENWDDGRLAK